MNQAHVTKDEWVKMFEEIGLDEATMRRWHGVFETRSPEGHQGFLEWLRIPAQDIERIREKSRSW